VVAFLLVADVEVIEVFREMRQILQDVSVEKG